MIIEVRRSKIQVLRVVGKHIGDRLGVKRKAAYLVDKDKFITEYYKDCVYVPPLPADLPDLRHGIEAVVARISSDILNKVWDELAYRLDVYLLFEGDARNRWRDGPVCPAVDQELWRLGPDGSGVFWRVMRQ
ncbi:hypothetical protein TNCV_3749001 [Trichonephila clavipes]|nr:hypothetical protein TNCV_3749001 [Trichonephila clavipes]